jgi:hypothetical protein
MPAVLGINTWGRKIKRKHLNQQVPRSDFDWLLTLGPFLWGSEHGALRRIEGELSERQHHRREFSDGRLKVSREALSTMAGCRSLCVLSLGQARESTSPSGEKRFLKSEKLAIWH